jgi:hypothetical protein
MLTLAATMARPAKAPVAPAIATLKSVHGSKTSVMRERYWPRDGPSGDPSL